MVILAFTTLPFHALYRLSMREAGINRPPDYIVLLGGGGMPSASGLMRTWYAAKAAGYFTRARVIVALPGDPADSNSSVNLMKRELILRGVAPDRIILEDSGTNTRAQALFILKRISNIEYRISNIERKSEIDTTRVTRRVTLLLVTSPEHLRRAVLAFRKAGFGRVDGLPAFEQAIEADILFSAGRLGGRRYIPDIGENLAVRYEFWTQMNYEFLILREWAAMGYYRLKGWI